MGKRPNLTQAQLDQIAELREQRGLSAARIAAIVGCSQGSVSWALLRIGVDIHTDKPLPPIPAQPTSVQRNGHVVRRFTQADDEVLLKLEAEGLNPGEIGRRMDPPRQPNSIRGRLMTLARREARAEAQQADA